MHIQIEIKLHSISQTGSFNSSVSGA